MTTSLSDFQGKRIHVRSEEHLERCEIGGFNFKEYANHVEVHPRLSREHYFEYMDAQLPEVPGVLESSLRSFNYLSDSARMEYLSSRKVVAKPDVSGEDRYIIVPRLPETAQQVAADTEFWVRDTLVDVSERKKKKTIPLASVLNDNDIKRRYQLTPKQLSSAAMMAIGNPAVACQFLEDAMNCNQEEIAVRVKPAQLLRTKAQAKISLNRFGKGCPYASAGVEAGVIGTTRRKLYMYGPEGCGERWHVVGPCDLANEVCMVYDLVSTAGLVDVNFVMGLELSLLGIDIFDGVSYEMPSIRFHVAKHGLASLRSVSSGEVSTVSKMQVSAMSKRLLPVEVEGVGQVATAVRISERHVLINAHVLDASTGLTVSGIAPTTYKQIGRDTWCCIAQSETKADSWRMRAPIAGESVAIAYTLDGEVRLTSALRIVSITESVLTLTKAHDVVEGTSGGAVVALSDLALLGIHSAETNVSLVACRFGSDQFTEIIEADETSSVSKDSDDSAFGALVVKTMKKKGVMGVARMAMSSVIPVFVGIRHVGMAVNVDGILYTACDGELPLRIGPERRPAVFEPAGEYGLFKTKNMYPELTSAHYTRAPTFGEKVFIIGYDQDDMFTSNETRVIHIGLSARSFVLSDIDKEDCALQGGLVMAWDGAVVGICGSTSASTVVGQGIQCRAYPNRTVELVNVPEKVLKAKFPFLNVESWDADIIEEVFTHSSAGCYKDGRDFNAGCKPLANVGDNVAKTLLYQQLRSKLIPHATWCRHMQLRQTNERFAEVAWALGFAECMITGPGTIIPRHGKPYADLTEALIGAVYLMEKPSVVETFCRALGVLYENVACEDTHDKNCCPTPSTSVDSR